MDVIQVKDKTFKLSIPSAKIQEQVSRVAAELVRDLDGRNPIFLCVLNGSFMFASDLLKQVNIPAEIHFVKVSSYQGTSSTGAVKQLIGLTKDITDRVIVIVEDIVDTGITMKQMLETLQQKNPAEIRICTLLAKPEKLQVPLKLDYVALEIPNDFIVGYGLDYDDYGRNWADIYTVVNE